MENISAREKGFEAEFARNQELAFRIAARRNKLFGLWAAGRLRLSVEETEAYIASVLSAAFEGRGDDELIREALRDFVAHGVDMREAELRRELARAEGAAREQLAAS